MGFILFQVNVLFSSCVGGYATCNCGVAVRSNFSLYVVITCAQISSTNTELLVVPHEKLTLNRSTDLHITKTGRLFKVIKINIHNTIFFLSNSPWLTYYPCTCKSPIILLIDILELWLTWHEVTFLMVTENLISNLNQIFVQKSTWSWLILTSQCNLYIR